MRSEWLNIIEDQHISKIKANNLIKEDNDVSIYKITFQNRHQIIAKYSNSKLGTKMLNAECKNLNAIENTNTIQVPGNLKMIENNHSCLLTMNFVKRNEPQLKDWIHFADSLNQLHETTSFNFGYADNNYIAKLDQNNEWASSWLEFYVEKRIMPQLKLSSKQGYLSEYLDKVEIKKAFEPFLKDIKPSLLHGDLWSGNFILNSNGAYLIDPASYYGDRMVDIAMAKLFGGFETSFYDRYFELNPSISYVKEKIDLYQLYYLLVHLNLFGRSYYTPCKQIMLSYLGF